MTDHASELARQLRYIEAELKRGDREPGDVRLLMERREAIRHEQARRT